MFKTFSQHVHARYTAMSTSELFVVNTEDLFTTYLLAFPDGTNPVFRTNTQHDCNCCKNFIRRLGNLRTAEGDTVWAGGDDLPHPYNVVAKALDNLVRQAPIKTVFRSKERQYGEEFNFDNETSQRWDHFHGKVGTKHFATDPATKRGERDAIYQVLKRGLEELNVGDFETVIDLIEGNGLYRGEEHLASVKGFRDLQRDYLNSDDRETFVWANLDNRNARFRNTVIGTLLTDLADGKDIEQAVRMFEAKVAPANYKRPTALITTKMVDAAVETLNKLGLEGAVQRRMARIEDVSVNDVLFVDNAVRGSMKDGVAGLLAGSVRDRTPNVKDAMPISFEELIGLNPKSIDLLVENSHSGNFVTITGGDGPERLFKWDNNFAWSYDGEVADSIKQRVKAAGGNINALLRVSLGWFNFDDLDLHCTTPRGERIYYGNKCGVLDVDMNAGGPRSRSAVENLAFDRLMDGTYKVHVNQFSLRETKDVGFTVEVEFAGVVHQFSYDKALRQGENVSLELLVSGGRLVSVKPQAGLVGGATSTDKWGIKTETLVPVEIICDSPNFWADNAVGNRHRFFILKGCRNPDAVRGIYNEFLRADLDKHRKVFEVLGTKTKCPPTDDQLSGVGFSSTRGDVVTVIVNGQRAYKVSI